MLFRVAGVNNSVELVYDNQESLINVYPAYHQIGDFQYQEIKSSDWTLPGTLYQYDIPSFLVNSDTIPLIQLVYFINSTTANRQQQYDAYKMLQEIETVEGHIYLRTNVRTSVDYRIRFRALNKQDLAITLNRSYTTGIAFQGGPEQLDSILLGYNPVSRATQNFYISVPTSDSRTTGAMPAGLEQRLAKLECLEAANLLQAGKNFKVTGYTSLAAVDAVSEYYTTIVDMQAVTADYWFRECSIMSRPGDTSFTDASEIFKEQQVTVLDLTLFYSNYVEDFSYSFSQNSALTSIQGLDLMSTKSATNMSYMFYNDSSLLELDLSDWITEYLTNIEGMFSGCTSLQKLDVSSFNFVDLIDQPDIFKDVPDSCEIWVGGSEQYDLIHTAYPNLTNIQYN